MKRIFLLLGIILLGLSVNANQLHSIVLEGTDDGYNIVLKTDELPAIHKTVKGNNNLIIDVKGVEPSASVNAIYRSTSEIKGLIVENVSKDELKIYINAKDISKSTILAQTPTLPPVILSDRFPTDKIFWSIALILLSAAVIKSANSITEYENSISIKKDIKDREIELYRKFQREMKIMPSLNSKVNSGYAANVMPRSRRNYKELARR